MIAPFVEVDKYAGRNAPSGYTVRSIYFDTFALDFYHQKMAGVEVRKKLRVRGYNDYEEGSIVFLEIKRKHGAPVIKNRAPVVYDYVQDVFTSGDIERYVLTGGAFPNALQDGRRFLFHVYSACLRPTVLIIYEREAYYGKFKRSLRITLDKSIRSSVYPALDTLFSEDRMSHSIPGHFILEVKFRGGIPSWLRSIIGTLNLRRMSLSKYVICLDTHRMPERFSRRSMLAFSHNYQDSATWKPRAWRGLGQAVHLAPPLIDIPTVPCMDTGAHVGTSEEGTVPFDASLPESPLELRD